MKQDEQQQYDALYQEAMNLLTKGERGDALVEQLSQKSEDIVLVTVIVKEARKQHYATLRKEGFKLVAMGVITGLSGLLITLLYFNTSRSIDFAMYGLTSIGITVVFWGLVKIIG